MTNREQRAEAKRFADEWKGKGYEKGESQKFWLSLLHDVYGIEHPDSFISFEDKVHLDHTSFIDGYISSTKVLIEQKGFGRDLRKAIKQSDGSYLTPFEQAKRYITELPLSKHPRWVVTCNFGEFNVYDMEKPSGGEPERIMLSDLEKEYYRLRFLVDFGDTSTSKEMEVSIKAGEVVGLLYDAFHSQYKDPDNPESLKSLNKLCVRLVFCLYAEDAGVFGRHQMFRDYLSQFEAKHMRQALINLFHVLDQKYEERDPYLGEDLASFPYVNGGLFKDENIEIPQFTDEIRELLLTKASKDFDWSEISPTIFGAVFESTLNPETRRKGGMHYTSIENIHKVIDPLFLISLKDELKQIKAEPVDRVRDRKLKEFQNKLSSLKFLDPAAGSGNFLTETYICLRRLENETLRLLFHGQGFLNNDSPIKVSISQFYGIEINDFAVTVSKTALWIAESQMMKETETIVQRDMDFLPLKTNANIVEGNALRMDWNDVVSKDELSYIMGNPPFIGYSLQDDDQKQDIRSLYRDEKGGSYKSAGKIDYVSGWFWKASELMGGASIKASLVATNSVTQGEQVAGIWKPLYKRFGIHIDFAYKSFRWDSEASLKAHVHCVIIGFSVAPNLQEKKLFDDGRCQIVSRINPYLLDLESIFVESRNSAICNVPEMIYGNKPTDGGFLFLTPEDRLLAVKQESQIEKFIRVVYGADEYINNKLRYCLWLADASPLEIRQSKFISERVKGVKEFRLQSKKAATRKSAETPTLFQEIRQPSTKYIIVPRHSSDSRSYIPFGFVLPEVIVSDAVQIIPDATLYHFGVLESNIHMAWIRTVAGRFGVGYRYSKDIVYNNFPWPEPNEEQRLEVEKTAQEILDAREKYPDCSLADLYDPVAMPIELRNAHRNNDKAVMAAYGIKRGHPAFDNEFACVEFLMKLYQKIVASL